MCLIPIGLAITIHTYIHTYIYIHGVYTVFLAGKSPNIPEGVNGGIA